MLERLNTRYQGKRPKDNILKFEVELQQTPSDQTISDFWIMTDNGKLCLDREGRGEGGWELGVPEYNLQFLELETGNTFPIIYLAYVYRVTAAGFGAGQ